MVELIGYSTITKHLGVLSTVDWANDGGKGGTTRKYVYNDTYLAQGKLSRAQAKAEKYVYDTFLKKNSKVAQYGKSVTKGLKAVKNMFN